MERTRIIAIIISTVLAMIGQIIFLQNMGNMATYNAHKQTGFFAAAALLVGGASVSKATIPNVFIGVVLLHLMYIVMPRAGAQLFGQAQIGEFFRDALSLRGHRHGPGHLRLAQAGQRGQRPLRAARSRRRREMKKLDPKSARKWAIRSALALVYIALAVLLFVTGRGHTILVDNKADPAGAYPALKAAVVSIDRLKAMEFYPGDRDKFVVQGQRHRIKVKALAPGSQEREFEFRVPLGQDMSLLSVSRLMAGVEPWIEVFVAPTVQERAAARAIADELNPVEIFGNSGP